jgi:hypothetical protein
LAHLEIRPVGEAVLPAQDQCERQIRKILRSTAFRNASMLQQLLQFLAAKAFDHGSETLKEYTIGVEALNRPQDFDPKTDTIVRVQIHRLRQKLKEYYDSDGSQDPIVVDIPKGHYVPSFEAAVQADAEAHPAAVHPLETPAPVAAFTAQPQVQEIAPAHEKSRRSWTPFSLQALVVAALALVIFTAGLWLGLHSSAKKDSRAAGLDAVSARTADPVKQFWTSFLGSDTAPVITYPDAVFLLDNSNDLFRYRRGASDDRGALVDAHLAAQFASNPQLVARAGQLYYENAYLGAGELKGLATLENLFGQMGIKPIVKASREITPDDLKQHNVIMLGSSFQNFAVAQLSAMGDFSFKNPDTRLEQWRGMIVNAHPRANEAAIYHTERDPVTQVLKTDYSLISIQPGVVAGRYIATLGGLDTTGTEGAILFATSRSSMDDLNKALAGLGESPAKDSPALFQALLSVQLEKGYEVLGTSLVTVHSSLAQPARAGTQAQAQ